MAYRSKTPDVERATGFLGEMMKQAGLAWRLLRDPQVPMWVKMIPSLAILYVISPIDLVPGLVVPGLGQLDDLAVLLIGLKLFIEISPKGIVQYYRDNQAGNPPPEPEGEGEVVDASYRVIDDE